MGWVSQRIPLLLILKGQMEGLARGPVAGEECILHLWLAGQHPESTARSGRRHADGNSFSMVAQEAGEGLRHVRRGESQKFPL